MANFFEEGASFNSINTYRSALALICPDVTKDPVLVRFIKGVFRSVPKYDITWDPEIVLNYFRNLGENKDLSLLVLSHKLVILLALVTTHIIQTISNILLSNIVKFSDKIIIKIPALIKTSVLKSISPVLKLPFFPRDPLICLARTLSDYIESTNKYRIPGTDKLFISYRKPYKAVSSETLSRWVKALMQESGVDTDIFSAHSTRHASTSAAFRKGVDLRTIRNLAGCNKDSNTFFKFYYRNT